MMKPSATQSQNSADDPALSRISLIEDVFRFEVHFYSIVSLEEGESILERIPEGGREGRKEGVDDARTGLW